jgi:hypothetical protein
MWRLRSSDNAGGARASTGQTILRYASLLSTALLFLAISSSLFAKAPITHEDVFLMKQAGAPIPSPDGKWVVFSLNEPAYDEAKQVSDLWLVPADGSPGAASRFIA